MADEPEQPERKTPPPPDLKKGPPPAPVPSALEGPPAESAPPPAPLKVSVAEDSHEDDDEEGGHGSEASLQDRVIGTVIDMVICIGIVIGVTFLLPGDWLDQLGQLAAIAYLLTRDSLPFLGGQSVGKKAMRIQAVTTDGKGLSGNWKPGLIRNVVLLIPLFPLVELFVLISRQDKPGPATRLGDEWAGTKVINVEEPVAAEAAAPPPPPAEPGDGE